MKILFIAMSESIHTARWISQITDQGWEVYLYPSVYASVSRRQIRNVTTFYKNNCQKSRSNQEIRFTGWRLFCNRLSTLSKICRDKIYPDARVKELNLLIKKIQPDMVHSLEFQHAGYLVSKAKEQYKGKFPTWIATNWGSDIYWFKQFPEHNKKIKEILQNADYYSAECNRDVCLAKDLGLKSKVFPVLPNTGGFDLKNLKKLRSRKTSERKIIMLKGYHGWAGRALVGLRALELCQKALFGYTVVLYSVEPGSDVETAAKMFSQKTGIKLKIIPLHTTHGEILKMHGLARISIGLSISDGISTSFLEAMVMGSFPIQSNTSCAQEWVENGRNGIIVPPEDPRAISISILKALSDDKLVDETAKINWQVAKNKLDDRLIKQKVIKIYKEVFKENPIFEKNNRRKTIFSILIEFLLIFWIILTMSIWLVKGIADSDFTTYLPTEIQQELLKAGQWIDRNVWRDY